MHPHYKEYLNGKAFHNALEFEIIPNKLIFRNSYLKKLVTNKKVVHLGFVDHLPLLEDKIKNGTWLHNQLSEVSEKCIGIDINKDGIKFLQENYSIQDLYCLDITKDELPEEINKESFDYLLLPDIIEHISNPVSFLSALKSKFPNAGSLIITTPNAFCFNNLRSSFKNIECINTDHRYWFTPYTISKILTDSGYQTTNIMFAEHGKLSKRRLIKNLALIIKPMLRSNLIVEARQGEQITH